MNIIDEYCYLNYNRYLRKKFGCKVFKVSLDAGFGCPSYARCTYCDDAGSGTGALKKGIYLKEQMEQGMCVLREHYNAEKFIAYFQSYTNTFLPVKRLKQLYDIPLQYDDVIGLDIGTRPDCIDEEKLNLIAGYAKSHYVWIEYGLQSSHNLTLKRIKRGHTVEQTMEAVKMTRERGINICLHVIIGLPGETYDDMMATADFVARMGVDGIKIHLLHIVKGSGLEKEYHNGTVDVMDMDTYINIVCDFLERLPKEMFIQRLTGESRHKLVAPLWCLHKATVIQSINKELIRRGSYQGKKYLL